MFEDYFRVQKITSAFCTMPRGIDPIRFDECGFAKI